MNDTNSKEITVIESGFSLVPRNLEEAMKFADIMAKSSVVPLRYKDKPGDILISVQMGKEVGLKPLQALQAIAVINGTPTLYGDGALSVVQGSGLLEDFAERDPAEALKVGAGWCKAKRKGQATPIERTFSIEDAKKANLWGKVGPWTSYPGRMLLMRARSWVLRDGFADALKGRQVTEEVSDFVPITDGQPMLPPPMPKRLSETKPAATEPIKQAEVAPQPKQQEPPKAQTLPEGSIIMPITVKEVLMKTGTTNGKQWTVYRISDTTGTVFSTFDEKIYQEALTLKGLEATITYLSKEKGNQLLAIEKYGESAEGQQSF